MNKLIFSLILSGSSIINCVNAQEVFYSQCAKQIGYEGSVLLENRNNALPLNNGCKIAIFGINQLDYIKGGGGSSNSWAPYVKNLLDGFEEKENEGKILLNKDLKEFYKNAKNTGSKIGNEPVISDELFSLVKNSSDIAIIALGRHSEEGGDRKDGKGDYLLSDYESDLINKVTQSGFKKVIVLLNIGSVVDCSWIKSNDKIDAAMINWMGGMEAGRFVADLLIGEAYPSGKLTTTFANSYFAYPTAKNYQNSKFYAEYEEDIYMGYRYFETLAKSSVDYEFGYGLGYTDFKIEEISSNVNDNLFDINLKIHNVGNKAGKEVIQLYYEAPQGKLGKPLRQLIAFKKTKELSPNEEEIVKLSFPINNMASYDDQGLIKDAAYVLEKGEYKFFVGNSVKNVKSVSRSYIQNQDKVVEQLSHQLVPRSLKRRMLSDGTYQNMNTGTFIVKPEGFTKIEFEDTDRRHQGLVIEEFDYKISGADRKGQAMAYFNASQRWIEYKLDVKQGGDYSIVLNASNAIQDMQNPFRVYVNGLEQRNIDMYIPKTADKDKNEWHVYAHTKPFYVNLPEGEVLLKFENAKNDINLDYMVIEKIKEKNNNNDKPDKKILLADVADKRDLMDSYLNQISDKDIIKLCSGTSNFGHPFKIGSMGALWKYGLPNIQTADGPTGVNVNVQTTAFPSSTMLACTWNLDLIEDFGVSIGTELTKLGGDILLAPGLNLHRNPLCGRNFEYYSEDPLISGKVAAAVTKGVQSKNVGVSIKHFAANNKENHRMGSDSRVSERAMRELYLKGFEIAVKESNPWTIMGSYNLINGVKATESYDLMTNILRNEWGYKGVVISDWCTAGSHPLEAKAGVSVKMPYGYPEDLLESVNNKVLTRDEINKNIAYLAELAMKCNSFDKYNQYLTLNDIKITDDYKLILADNIADCSYSIRPEACQDKENPDVKLNLSYCDQGEWVEYDIEVLEAGIYTVYPRVAVSYVGGKIDLFIDKNKIAAFNIESSTGGWQKWSSLDNKAQEVTLTKGKHKLSMKIGSGGFNINTLNFKLKTPLSNCDINNKDSELIVYLSSNNLLSGDVLLIERNPAISDKIELKLLDSMGKIIVSDQMKRKELKLKMPSSKGVYFLRAKNNKTETCQKVVIN